MTLTASERRSGTVPVARQSGVQAMQGQRRVARDLRSAVAAVFVPNRLGGTKPEAVALTRAINLVKRGGLWVNEVSELSVTGRGDFGAAVSAPEGRRRCLGWAAVGWTESVAW